MFGIAAGPQVRHRYGTRSVCGFSLHLAAHRRCGLAFRCSQATLAVSRRGRLSSSYISDSIKIKIYRTIILPVVLYGCDTWSFTLREERRLRVFENRVLRRIFGTRRDEVTKGVEKIT